MIRTNLALLNTISVEFDPTYSPVLQNQVPIDVLDTGSTETRMDIDRKDPACSQNTPSIETGDQLDEVSTNTPDETLPNNPDAPIPSVLKKDQSAMFIFGRLCDRIIFQWGCN